MFPMVVAGRWGSSGVSWLRISEALVLPSRMCWSIRFMSLRYFPHKNRMGLVLLALICAEL